MIPIRDHNPSGKFPAVTIFLILVNCYVFFLELTSKNIESFIYTYALVPKAVKILSPATLWPFFTSMFLHAGWLHLLSNMWFLWIFGDNIEAKLGKIRYLLYYLIAGINGGLAQYLAAPNSTIPMLGASGAIAGILGAYMAFYPYARIETLIALGFIYTRSLIPASIMLFYWFIIQLFSGFTSILVGSAAMGGVAFLAHAGGFATGFLMAKSEMKT